MPGGDRPVVLLDVDGVLNHWSMHGYHEPPGEFREAKLLGYWVTVPEETISIVLELAQVAEVIWCTAWRDYANSDLGPWLGLPEFEVLVDAEGARGADWKVQVVTDRLEQWLAEGRRVYWIEDFEGSHLSRAWCELADRVVCIDTSQEGSLQRSHLPEELVALMEGVSR